MKKLNFIEIAALYIGIIMGAGFASGRECWQFFGVFKNDGYFGAIIVCIGFVFYGIMLTYIGYLMRISSILNFVYGIVLFGSIYSTGAIGLTGFTTLVEILYPIQGYIGLLYLLLIFVNFCKVLKKNEILQ